MITTTRIRQSRKLLGFKGDFNLANFAASVALFSLLAEKANPNDLVSRYAQIACFVSLALILLFARSLVIFDEDGQRFVFTNTIFTSWRRPIPWSKVKAIQLDSYQAVGAINYSAWLKIEGRRSRRELFLFKKLPDMQTVIEMAEISRIPVEYKGELFLPSEELQRLSQLPRIRRKHGTDLKLAENQIRHRSEHD